MTEELVQDAQENQPDLFEAEISANLPTVLSSRISLRHIFENLLTNAIRYREPSRSLKTKVISLPSYRGQEMIEFIDKGVGIAEQDLASIFNPFFRVAVTSDREGTGLGLSFCRQTIERLGGTISVRSELGVGTIFRIRLPSA